jgi:hypothetical protein
MTTSINQRFNIIIGKLASCRLISIISFALLCQIITMYIISTYVFKAHPGGFEYRSIAEHFVISVIAAPIIESYIFQRGIIHLTLRIIKSTRLFAVLLSATGFALTHFYSLPYVIVTFFIGILYATIYLVFLEKNAAAFWWLTMIHASYNLFAFILNSFFSNSN